MPSSRRETEEADEDFDAVTERNKMELQIDSYIGRMTNQSPDDAYRDHNPVVVDALRYWLEKQKKDWLRSQRQAQDCQ